MTTFSGTAHASQCRSCTRSRSAISSNQLSVTRRCAKGFTSLSVWRASRAILRTRLMTRHSLSRPELMRSNCAGMAVGSIRSSMGCWSIPARISAAALPVVRRFGGALPSARRFSRRWRHRRTKSRNLSMARWRRRSSASSSETSPKSSLSSQLAMTSLVVAISNWRRARRARNQCWTFLAAHVSGSARRSSSPRPLTNISPALYQLASAGRRL
mmetsp:Transcript_113/g.379  ORF Transcript_113/g.379 Transcript_113/m.379 type:complete len:214 (-) Transcript_113:297-938(-)